MCLFLRYHCRSLSFVLFSILNFFFMILITQSVIGGKFAQCIYPVSGLLTTDYLKTNTVFCKLFKLCFTIQKIKFISKIAHTHIYNKQKFQEHYIPFLEAIHFVFSIIFWLEYVVYNSVSWFYSLRINSTFILKNYSSNILGLPWIKQKKTNILCLIYKKLYIWIIKSKDGMICLKNN